MLEQILRFNLIYLNLKVDSFKNKIVFGVYFINNIISKKSTTYWEN